MGIGPVNIGGGDTAEELMKQHLEAKNPHNITAQDVGADLAGAAQNALQAAKTYMDGKISELNTGVSSFNGRTGGVMPQTGDYTAEMVGAAAKEHGTHVEYSGVLPLEDGMASVGTASEVARSDHRHHTDTTRAASNHTHSASDVGAVPTTRTVNNKPLSEDIELSAQDVKAVPTTRTVNNKPLSADIELSAQDVKAVPTTRTVNNKPLSEDISLEASDIGAVDMQKFTFNVPADSWSEDSDYYFATVSVPGIKATDDPEYVDIQRSTDYAADDMMAEQFALVMSMTTTDNKIKLRAVEKPALELKIRMKVFR